MTLNISIWSDVACPWCYVGKRRLEAALRLVAEEMGEAPAVSIEYKAFELDPKREGAGGGDYVGRLASKYGIPPKRAQEMIDQMVKTGREEGLAFDFSHAIPANTFDAHRLLLLARSEDEKGASEGLQTRLKELLFRAHFEEGADVGSHETLISIAGSAGLDVDRVSAVLGSDDFGEAVRDDEEEAKVLGVRGVPFFVIGRFGVGGAERPSTLAGVVKKALSEAAAEEAEILGDDVCLPGEC